MNLQYFRCRGAGAGCREIISQTSVKPFQIYMFQTKNENVYEPYLCFSLF